MVYGVFFQDSPSICQLERTEACTCGSAVVLIDERHLADFYDLAVTLAIHLKAKCRDFIFYIR